MTRFVTRAGVALCFVGEHDPPEESDATLPLHRQSPGRRGDRRDAADDRPVGRQAVRGHCGGHGAGHRSGRAGGRARARRRLGTPRAGGEGPSARETRARDPRPCRRARAARGARLRQADEAGARRRRGLRPLFRVLRRRVGQAVRRHDPVSRRVHGADVARAARRHRPHHPVELSAADFRPLGRRCARRGERLRREAGRGRLPVAAARRRAGGGHRLAGGRAQHRHGARARGRRRARHASRHRAPVVHGIARDGRLGRR